MLVDAANRLAVIEDRPVLAVGIDRRVAAGLAHGERHHCSSVSGVYAATVTSPYDVTTKVVATSAKSLQGFARSVAQHEGTLPSQACSRQPILAEHDDKRAH